MVHFSESPTVDSLFKSNPRLADQVREIVAKGQIQGIEPESKLQRELEAYLDPKPRRGRLESTAGSGSAQEGRRRTALEAIVRLVGRPPLFVQGGTYVIPAKTTRAVPQATIDYIEGLKKSRIDAAISRTGRVDVIDIPGMPFVGTAWIVEKRKAKTAIMVTNRHVAEVFAHSDSSGGFRFMTAPNFRPFEIEIDFVHEHENGEKKQARVRRVLYIAGADDPDMALLEVEGDVLGPLEPLDFSTVPLKRGQEIGVVGYPAYDSRNDDSAIARYFDGIFNVKRFAFGEVMGVSQRAPEFTHDATTLGGNSGSKVFDLKTGKVVGLHFAGDFKSANFAVPIEQIAKALKGLKTTAVVKRGRREAISDGIKPVSFYRGRDGFNRGFLGAGHRVDLPKLGRWSDDAAEVKDADAKRKTKELKYRHFSVIMSKSRKLPILTAVNIDGSQAKRLGRIDKWYVDGRLSGDFQVGNEAYAKNPLDRGHMVRREDPVWGDRKVAEQANIDTFHYTNAAPQHEALNQRDWVGLEDYVLGNARTHDLMVSVLTGPILRDDDPLYNDVVNLPREFWKIAVIVDEKSRKLSATGYVLSQGKLIKKLTEAFVYGAFRTYQVPISLIATETGLDLSALEPHDPFARRREKEGLEGTTTGLFNPIASAADIVMG
jgi:endonuclease G